MGADLDATQDAGAQRPDTDLAKPARQHTAVVLSPAAHRWAEHRGAAKHKQERVPGFVCVGREVANTNTETRDTIIEHAYMCSSG